VELVTPVFTDPTKPAHQMTTQPELEAFIHGLDDADDNMYIFSIGKSATYGFDIPIVFFTKTDLSGCTTLEEVEAVLAGLSGKKVGYQIGTTGGMYVNGDEDWGYAGFANLEGKGYATAQDAVTDLINGNLYAVVVDEAPANALVKAANN
jgi:ABC-type amino acid transport substrate-binding protein